MRLVDAHCHLDLYPDYKRVISETDSKPVWTIAVTNAPSVFKKSAEIVAGRKHIRIAAGLHPELAHERISELPQLVELIWSTRFVGEVGLDYTTPDPEVRHRQRHVFSTVLQTCHLAGGRILSIHSRRASSDVIALIREYSPGVPILHWPSIPKKTLAEAIELGCYFSVNSQMLRSRAGQELLLAIPLNRLLTETDGPFTSTSGQPSSPVDVELAIETIAKLLNSTREEISETVWRNFCVAIDKHKA